MQAYSSLLVHGVRISFLVTVMIILFFCTRLSTKVVKQAKQLPLIFTKTGEESVETEERASMLKAIARRWNLYTIIELFLVSLLIIEIIIGLSAANSGFEYYIAVHVPSILGMSVAVSSILAVIVIWFFSPFNSGTIDPIGHLLDTLESLIEAAKPEERGGHGYVDSILLRVVAQEIELCMENRKMGEAERGRLLEYLSKQEGVIGEVASSLLWPI